MIYVVKQGDCMASIGAQNGFYWKTLWDHPDNAALKSSRKNPNVLFVGDKVTVPDKQLKMEPGSTEARHRFRLKGVPEKLRLKLLDPSQKPRAGLDYILIIDGDSRRGTTNANGELIEDIPPAAEEGELRLGKKQAEVMKLHLGHLDPVSETSGVKARLANLGFYGGAIDDTIDEPTQLALRSFQKDQGLNETGAADDATKQKLQKMHGH